MPISNLSQVTVTGRYAMLDGTPAQGTIAFAPPSTPLADQALKEIIIPVKFVATLDSNGAFSITLPATDDPDVTPTNFYYTVTENIVNGIGRSFGITLPAHMPTIDMADLAPGGPIPTPVYNYATVAYVYQLDQTNVKIDRLAMPDGVATLDSHGKIPASQIPDTLLASASVLLASVGQPGGVAPLDGSGQVPASFLANAAQGSFIPLSQKGAASGVATLDSSTKIPASQIPSAYLTQTQSDARYLQQSAADLRYMGINTLVVRTVNGYSPNANGDITLSGGAPVNDASGTVKGLIKLAGDLDPASTADAPKVHKGHTVPFHAHKFPFQQVDWIRHTRNYGSAPQLELNGEYLIVMNDNTTINMPVPQSNFYNNSITNNHNESAPALPDGTGWEKNEFDTQWGPGSDKNSAGMTVGVFLVQDDVGSHTVTWNFERYQLLGAIPAMPTTPYMGIYCLFRWLGWRVGWVLVTALSNVTPPQGIYPSSATYGAPTYVRVVRNRSLTSMAAGNALLTHLLDIPEKIRRALYFNGTTIEYNGDANAGRLLNGSTDPNANNTDYSNQVDGALVTTNEFAATHEMGHALDSVLYKGGKFITYPDDAFYWWNQSTPRLMSGGSGSNMHNQGRYIYWVKDDPAMINLYRQAYAAYTNGATYWGVNADYAMYGYGGPSTNNPTIPGSDREFLAENFKGYCRYLKDGRTTGDFDTFDTSVPPNLVQASIDFWNAATAGL